MKGVARRSHRTIARQALLHTAVRANVLKVLKSDVQKELKLLCANHTKSLFRSSSCDTFTWDELSEELESVSPTLYAFLDACMHVSKRKHKHKRSSTRYVSNTAAIALCAGLILHHCSHNKNLIQLLISLILHSGHSGKQVLHNNKIDNDNALSYAS